MVGASYDNICMVEGESKEVSEEEIVEALKVAHEAIKTLCELQNELLKKLEVKRIENILMKNLTMILKMI